jgi:hypothetical protein
MLISKPAAELLNSAPVNDRGSPFKLDALSPTAGYLPVFLAVRNLMKRHGLQGRFSPMGGAVADRRLITVSLVYDRDPTSPSISDNVCDANRGIVTPAVQWTRIVENVPSHFIAILRHHA